MIFGDHRYVAVLSLLDRSPTSPLSERRVLLAATSRLAAKIEAEELARDNIGMLREGERLYGQLLEDGETLFWTFCVKRFAEAASMDAFSINARAEIVEFESSRMLEVA